MTNNTDGNLSALNRELAEQDKHQRLSDSLEKDSLLIEQSATRSQVVIENLIDELYNEGVILTLFTLALKSSDDVGCFIKSLIDVNAEHITRCIIENADISLLVALNQSQVTASGAEDSVEEKIDQIRNKTT